MTNRSRTRIFAGLAALSLAVFAPINSAQAATKLAFTDAENHRVISIKANTQVSITLNSTFWLDATATNLKAVKAKSQTVIPFGPTAPEGCQHPGTGCGTSIWVFKATKKGPASFTVSRDSCGEALRCTGANATYLLRFLVK